MTCIKLVAQDIIYIGEYTFKECYGLTDVYCYAENIPKTGYYSPFGGMNQNKATLHVPKASLDIYKAATPWNALKKIVPLTDKDTTPLNNIDGDAPTSIYYDLNGRRVRQPRNGLNIINGRKVLVK